MFYATFFKFSTSWTGWEGSSGDIIMPTKARDNALGAYDSSTGRFTVPEDGRYELTLHLVSYSTNNAMYFYIDMYLDDETYDTMRRRAHSYSGSYSDDLTLSMITEVEAKKGSVIRYKVTSQYAYARLSRPNCYFNGVQVGCSYIQGKLIKRY